MIKNYRYDVMGADMFYNVHEHPQVQIKKLGFNIIKAEAVPIADCWWFRSDSEVEELPGYIREMPDDFKFSGE